MSGRLEIPDSSKYVVIAIHFLKEKKAQFMKESVSKAVRDKIPEIIGVSGRECVVKKIPDSAFLLALENKLGEEVKEYFESKDVEELVDLLEVINRIAELRGFSKDELETLRLKKKSDKGGFEKNLLLFEPFSENHLSIDPEFICSVNSIDANVSGAQYNPVNSTNPINRVQAANPEPAIFKSENAEIIDKHGVRIKIYTSKNDSKNAAVLYQETDKGHSEEFLHEKSDFIYYILEGSGTWVIEDKEFEVKTGDVIIVPAGERFWFHGTLKQICITAPAWEEKYEHHIRNIEL